MIFYSTTADPGSTGTDETGGTSTYYRNDYVDSGWTSVSPQTADFEEEIRLEQIRQLTMANVMKAFLKEGLFLVLNPPKKTIGTRKMFWLRVLRCNHHGIGLRLREV